MDTIVNYKGEIWDEIKSGKLTLDGLLKKKNKARNTNYNKALDEAQNWAANLTSSKIHDLYNNKIPIINIGGEEKTKELIAIGESAIEKIRKDNIEIEKSARKKTVGQKEVRIISPVEKAELKALRDKWAREISAREKVDREK
jgi:hypothetical protein